MLGLDQRSTCRHIYNGGAVSWADPGGNDAMVLRCGSPHRATALSFPLAHNGLHRRFVQSNLSPRTFPVSPNALMTYCEPFFPRT